MKTRFIDTISQVKKIAPPEIKPPVQKPLIQERQKKSKKFPWLKVFAGTLFIFLLSFIFLFWYGLLGEKFALIRLFLGLNGKYLVLFQNNTELRPSGGFIGSFAEVEIQNGKIKNWTFETNIWKRNKEFAKKQCITPLKPFVDLWNVKCLNLVDSNFSPDFQKSAKDFEWFYSQVDDNSFDGIIALDTTFFTDLLKIVGAIELPQYNLTLTPENFVKETQYQVEKKYWQDPQNWIINEPKTILKDMMPIVLGRVKNPKLTCALLTILKRNLSEKHLLFSFKNSQLSKIVRRNNWGGEVKQTAGDYLYINNANLGGLKSSLNVKQLVNLRSQIQSDGTILDTLTIIRSHQGDGVWPDSTNQNYTRVLVPKGSMLKSKQGIDVVDYQEELGKSVFSFWTTVAPGETKAFQISYLLPVRKEEEYSLLIQKQPGSLPDQFNFILDETLRWRWEGKIDKDRFIQIDLTKK